MIWFHVDPASGLPIYLQLANQVKKATAGGILRPGDQLPSVRELAAQLAVNPNTVAKAYQELERDGVIATSRGKGTFVAEGGGSKLIRQERERVLYQAIDSMLVEAHHLGFARDEVAELFQQRLGSWWPRDGERAGDRNGDGNGQGKRESSDE